MRSAAAVLSSASLIFACTDRGTFELPIDPGDVIVAVFLDTSGSATEVRRYEVERSTQEIEVRPDESLVSFHLPRARFIDEAGASISEEWWRNFEVVRAGEASTSGACGRVQVPSIAAPQTVVPGDRARVPAWAEARIHPAEELTLTEGARVALIEAARGQVELAWPGACDCSLPAMSTRSNVEVCPLDAPVAAIAARALAISDRGTVFGATLGFVLRAPIDGAAQLVPISPAMEEVELITPTPNDGVLLVSSLQTLFSAQGAELRYFDDRLRELPVVGAPPIRTNRAYFREDGTLVFLGRRARNTSLYECGAIFEERSLTLECTEAALEGGDSCPLLNLQAAGRLLFPGSGGRDLLLTSLGVVAERDSGGGSFRCLRQEGRSDPRWTLSSTVTIEAPEIIAAESLASDRFLAVVHAGGGLPNGQVQTALVHGVVVRDGEGNAERVDYSLLETTIAPELRGHMLKLMPGTPLQMVSVRGVGADFVANVYDQDGRRTAQEPSWFRPSPPRRLIPQVDSRVLDIQSSPNRTWVVLRDDEYALFRGPSSGEGLGSLGGRAPPLSASNGLVVELDSESALAVSGLGIFRLTPGPACGQDEFEPIPVAGMLPAAPVAIIPLPGGGSRFLVIATRELARLDLARRESRLLPIAPPRGGWVTGAPLGPDSVVLLDEAGRLHVLEGEDELRAVDLGPVPEEEVPYLSLAGQDGVVWAGGFDRLDRLRLVGPDELRIEPVLEVAERSTWDEVARDRRRPPFVTGFGLRCRSSALVHTAEDLNVGAGLSVSDKLRIFELSSDTDRLIVSNPSSFENVSDALPTEYGIFPQINWLGDAPVSIFPHPKGTLVYAHGTEPRALPFNAVSSSANAGEWVVSTGGQLLILDATMSVDEKARVRRFAPEGFRVAKSRLRR